MLLLLIGFLERIFYNEMYTKGIAAEFDRSLAEYIVRDAVLVRYLGAY